MGKPVLPSYQQFQKRSAEQLQQGALLLERLRTTPRDAEAAGDLQRVFHRFAGMAEAFGHERAGVLGKQGDGEILRWFAAAPLRRPTTSTTGRHCSRPSATTWHGRPWCPRRARRPVPPKSSRARRRC
jgi:hypothetical protein